MKRNNSGVTILELLVIVSIIMIMAIGTSKLNFSRLSDKQKLDIFINKMISTYEITRNNALIGKGVGVDIEYPEEWAVEFTASGTGGVKTYYSSGAVLQDYSMNNVMVRHPMVFESIECLDRDDNLNETLSGSTNVVVLMKGKEVSLGTGCSDPDTRKVQMNILYRGHREKFAINIINGLVEK